jgi:pimeloyl-ACP methyl ester carboxylesterase
VEGFSWLPRVRGVVTIASPALLRQREGLWRDLFSERALTSLGELHTPGGWIDLVEFTLAQGMLANPRLRPGHLLRRGVAASLWLGSHSARIAGFLMKTRGLPTFLHNTGDYTPEQFRDVLAGGVLNRAPVRLVREILSMGMAGPRGGHLVLRSNGVEIDVSAAVDRMTLPILAFASEEDQLVTAGEALGLADRPGLTKVLLPPCGHGGYFFKRETRDVLFSRVREFLEAILPPLPATG